MHAEGYRSHLAQQAAGLSTLASQETVADRISDLVGDLDSQMSHCQLQLMREHRCCSICHISYVVWLFLTLLITLRVVVRTVNFVRGRGTWKTLRQRENIFVVWWNKGWTLWMASIMCGGNQAPFIAWPIPSLQGSMEVAASCCGDVEAGILRLIKVEWQINGATARISFMTTWSGSVLDCRLGRRFI